MVYFLSRGASKTSRTCRQVATNLYFIVLVEERGSDEIVSVCEALRRVGDARHQVVEDVKRPLQAGRLERVIVVAAASVRVGSVLHQKLCSL